MEYTAEHVQQSPALNTRQRIVEAALELFNQEGERHVTTNHIAAHLSISPGNLYYHFRNKQAIVLELFSQFEAMADPLLQRPQNRQLTIADKAFLNSKFSRKFSISEAALVISSSSGAFTSPAGTIPS